jgi:hypothetical protein
VYISRSERELHRERRGGRGIMEGFERLDGVLGVKNETGKRNSMKWLYYLFVDSERNDSYG